MSRTKLRIAQFEELVGAEDIAWKKFRALCHTGIPDKPGLRAICWKLLLGYLPLSRSKWEKSLESQRGVYAEFVKDLLIDTHKEAASASTVDPLGAITEDEGKPSTWDSYFKENEVLEQIDKDVKRLCPDFQFFQTPTPVPAPEGVRPLWRRVQRGSLSAEEIVQNRKGVTKVGRRTSSSDFEVPTSESCEHHWEVVERILFVYAKLNPGIGYVQGMNEILGPIYYMMASDPNETWSLHAEADTFFCFTALMSEIRDSFIKTLDDSSMGIGALMRRLVERLTITDHAVAARLAEQQIKPQFYSFRWLTLLLSQEFQLPELMRLWDSLFASKDRVEYLLCICVSMMVNIRDRLLENEFADNIKLLQHYPEIDVFVILTRADAVLEQINHERKHAEFVATGRVR